MTPDDFPFVVGLFGEEEVLRGVTRSALDTPEKIMAWISGVHERADCRQYLILLEAGDMIMDYPAIMTSKPDGNMTYNPVGLVTLKDMDKDGSKAATLGIAITGIAQGKGVGKKALLKLFQICRDNFSYLNTLKAEIYSDNTISAGLFSGLGFITGRNVETNEGREYHTWFRSI